MPHRFRYSSNRGYRNWIYWMLQLYWTIGNNISNKIIEVGWGGKIIDNLSKDLKIEFPDSKGFSVRNLKHMRSFAEAYPDFLQANPEKLDKSIVQPLVANTGATLTSVPF